MFKPHLSKRVSETTNIPYMQDRAISDIAICFYLNYRHFLLPNRTIYVPLYVIVLPCILAWRTRSYFYVRVPELLSTDFSRIIGIYFLVLVNTRRALRTRTSASTRYVSFIRSPRVFSSSSGDKYLYLYSLHRSIVTTCIRPLYLLLLHLSHLTLDVITVTLRGRFSWSRCRIILVEHSLWSSRDYL